MPKAKSFRRYSRRGNARLNAIRKLKKNEAPAKSQGKDQKDGAKQYTVQSYATSEDVDAYIYLVEIEIKGKGKDKDEVFEFWPKDGRCTVRVYFAPEEENEKVRKLKEDRRWSNCVKRMFLEGEL